MKPKKQLREEAEARDAERAKRTDAQQLALIEKRPGNSSRERAKIEARIARARQKKEKKK